MTSPTPPTPPPPVQPLRREVEPPRPPIGPWMPLSLLGTATMLTIATAFGVMTRMPRDVPTTPATDASGDQLVVAPATSQRKVQSPTMAKEDPRAGDVRKAVEERRPALEACMRKWAKRSSRSAVGSTVAFFLKPNGVITGVWTAPRNGVELACIAKPLRTMKLPSGSEEAFVTIALRYVDDELDVFTKVMPESAFGPP